MSRLALAVAELLFFVVALATTSASGQITVIRAGRVLDPSSRSVLSDQAVVVEGERIRDVSAFSTAEIPADARLIDLSSATLLPGLIDAHTHLLLETDPSKGSGDESFFLAVAQMSTAQRALLGARTAGEMLRAGYTAVRDLGNSGVNGDVALRDAIEAGWIEGPRMMVSTRALSPPGGQFGRLPSASQPIVDQEYAVFSGVEAARRAARQAFVDGAGCLKVIVEDHGRSLSQEELRAIVEEARRLRRDGWGKRPVAAHATDNASIRAAIEAGVDSIEHGYSISDENLELMAKKGVYFVPTDGSVQDPVLPLVADRLGISLDQLLERGAPYRKRSERRLRRAIELGVTIAAGSDSYIRRPNLDRGQAAKLTLRAYQEAGLGAWEILRAATINAARLMGRQRDLGAVKPKLYADLLAVEGDPIEKLSALEDVVFVMKAGKVVVGARGHIPPE